MRQMVESLEKIFANGRVSQQSEHDSTIRDLHAKIGELTLERDFFCAGFSIELRGESGENLALMQRMDALSLWHPFYGSRQMARHLSEKELFPRIDKTEVATT